MISIRARSVQIAAKSLRRHFTFLIFLPLRRYPFPASARDAQLNGTHYRTTRMVRILCYLEGRRRSNCALCVTRHLRSRHTERRQEEAKRTMATTPPTRRSSKIDDRLREIEKAWEKASWAKYDAEEKLRPPYDKANSKLKRAVYRLVRDCIKNDLVHALKESVEHQFGDRSHVKPSPANAENPFYWGFMAVCGTENKLARSNKSRFSQELMYAHMHDVPPQFLIGFIYQIGSSKDLQRKIENKDMQTWFNPENRN